MAGLPMEQLLPRCTVRQVSPGERLLFPTAEEIRITHWLDPGPAPPPRVGLRLFWSIEKLIGRFEVAGETIRCVHRRFQSPVYQDSCVEFFFRPHQDRGYFNFEFNCAGTLLAYYISDWRRVGSAFAHYMPLTEGELSAVAVRSTFERAEIPIEPRRADWWLEFEIPFRVLQAYTGLTPNIQDLPCWRGNAYKCADLSPSPHWGSWAPLREKNFHSPEEFGLLLPERRAGSERPPL